MGLEVLDEVTREDVELAIRSFSKGEVSHEFEDSTGYDLVHEGRRYPPKAIVGIAARRAAGRVLHPSEFSGGVDSKCNRVLVALGFEVARKTPPEGDEWTDAELDAAVEAYLEMLAMELRGVEFNKAEINRALREGPLAGRGRGAIEYRMQNISSVLNKRGGKWILGYKPAANVGANVEKKIAEALARAGKHVLTDSAPELPGPELDRKVRRARKRVPSVSPAGVAKPERTSSVREEYRRDPLVKAWVLENAKGRCELCGGAAPFSDDGGFPYLEVHHVKFLAEGGSDTTSNAVALCPNCHRRCHVSADRAESKEKLYTSIPRLQQE